MRKLTIILAAAAAPAALAGVLLGTAGQASAATAPAAATVAAVHAPGQAPKVVIAHTHRSGVLSPKCSINIPIVVDFKSSRNRACAE